MEIDLRIGRVRIPYGERLRITVPDLATDDEIDTAVAKFIREHLIRYAWKKKVPAFRKTKDPTAAAWAAAIYEDGVKA